MKFRQQIILASLLALAFGPAILGAEIDPSRLLKAREDDAHVGGMWEPIRIAQEAGHIYLENTIVKFHPSGMAYVCFDNTDENGKRSIKLYKYDGKNSTLVKDISETKMMAYEPDMEIDEEGFIHIVWAEAQSPNALNQYLRYRYFDGVNWSAIITLRAMQISGEVGGHNTEKIDDVRLAVDADQNLFVTYMIWPDARCQTISRYGDKVYIDAFPKIGRSKHTCVAVDDNFVHIAWIQMEGSYCVYYARRANRAGSSFSTVLKVIQPSLPPDRPDIATSKDGGVHLVYLRSVPAGGREIQYRTWKGGGFTPQIVITGTNTGTYHPPSIAAYDNDNVFVFVQTWAGGVRNYYNWRKNGSWGGFVQNNQIKVNISCGSAALSSSGVAAFAYSAGGSIQLVLSGPLEVNVLPVAVLNVDKESLFWGETISMNSNGSYDPDGTIVKYEWKIVQDNVILEGATANYTFNKRYNSVKVRLSAIDEKGGRGNADKIIQVKALYTAQSKATKKNIQTLIYNKEGYVVEWTPNSKNEAAGYTIVKYKIFRKEGSGDYVEVGEVGSERRVFADVSIESGKTYTYAVSSVDDQGRMSPYDNY